MNDFFLFTDASLNAKHSIGAGAYMLLSAAEIDKIAGGADIKALCGFVRLRKFSEVSSTALEIKTAVWALKTARKELSGNRAILNIYTDSQCLAGLARRRSRLERSDFASKRTGDELKNARLYREFFKLYDDEKFDIYKLRGHTRSAERDVMHSIFSLLDREARKALRIWVLKEDLILKG